MDVGSSLSGIADGVGKLDPLSSIIDFGASLLGLPPEVKNVTKLAVGAVTGDPMLIAVGATSLVGNVVHDVAHTEYAPGGQSGMALNVGYPGYAAPSGAISSTSPLDPNVVSYRDSLRTLDANFSTYAAMSGGNGSITRGGLTAIYADPGASPELKQASDFLVRHPEYFSQLQNATFLGGLTGISSATVRSELSRVNQQLSTYGVPAMRGVGPTYGTRPMYGTGPAYGAQPMYGTGRAYGAQPMYGTSPAYGAQPMYGAGPSYGMRPTYGAGSSYGARSMYGTGPTYGARSMYGTGPMYGTPPPYGSVPAIIPPSPFGPAPTPNPMYGAWPTYTPPSSSPGQDYLRNLLNAPGMPVEDKVENVLQYMSESTDGEMEGIVQQMANVQDQRAGATDPQQAAQLDQSYEQLQLRLQRTMERRQEMFTLQSNISQKFDEMAKVAIQNLGR